MLAWELLEPTPAFDHIAEHYIKPHKDLLLSIIIAVLGKDPGPDKLLPCAVSIISQCVYYSIAAPIIERITGINNNAPEALDNLATFVWQFSPGGIAAIAHCPDRLCDNSTSIESPSLSEEETP